MKQYKRVGWTIFWRGRNVNSDVEWSNDGNFFHKKPRCPKGTNYVNKVIFRVFEINQQGAKMSDWTKALQRIEALEAENAKLKGLLECFTDLFRNGRTCDCKICRENLQALAIKIDQALAEGTKDK